MSSENEIARNDLQISESDDNEASDSSQSSDTEEAEKQLCRKLMLPEHLAAYMEERELDRDVEPIQCNAEIEKIFDNYVIVKNILSHLRWQEKLICKRVCRLWNSVVKRLHIEQMQPVDFSINAGYRAVRDRVSMVKSSEFHTEPLAVFTFCTAMAYFICSNACQRLLTYPPCDEIKKRKIQSLDDMIGMSENCALVLDVLHQETTAPKDCMYTVKASSVSYMPLPHSLTIENIITFPSQSCEAAFYGIYIPKVPGVEFKIININCSNGIQQDLKPEIKKLTENYTVKGVVACLTENYLLYVDENNAECLSFLNLMQPETPFAFGGCLVEDTATESQDLVGTVDCLNKNKEYVSGNIMSLGVFVTPKGENSTSVEEPRNNFEAYSVVLESSEWSKLKISQSIKEFSESVPRFEHSVALKFSCMARQHKHEDEQEMFRLHFPRTRLGGCFGNGELGVDHPRRESQATPKTKHAAKRPRECVAYEKVHSYSTVFFYIGWGKIIKEAGRDEMTEN